MPSQADGPSDEPPEFYFTRLMYSGGRGGRFGGFGFGAGGERECATLREGEGGGGGGGAWATDYPASDCKFMWGVERLTNIRVYDKSPHSITIMDPELFKFPYIYAVEVGRGMDLSTEEAERLREYLLRGGFLHIDDFWGLEERYNFEYQISKIFPDRKIEKLPLSHEVFHTFFDIDKVVQIPNVSLGCNGGRTYEDPSDIEPVIYGISNDDGRLMVVVTYNSDLGDAWEWMDRPCYPQSMSGQAYRMGINFMIYAMSH
jgi:hypothetical protein